MRGCRWLVGIVGFGLLVFSCGGEDFGILDPNASDAGASSLAGGGEDAAAGTSADGGRSGSSPAGGAGNDAGGVPAVLGGNDTGGAPTVLGGNGSAGSPDPVDCSDVIAPELPGDCQKLVCSMGTLTSQPDASDTPEPRGPCDVPKCDDGQPTFSSDLSKCKVNQACNEGTCACAGCPNGKVATLSSTLCRLPAMVVITADKTNMGSAASRVADGDGQTTWNSGGLNGVLKIIPAQPQAMTAIAMWLTGLADNTVPAAQKVIQVHASIEVEGGPAIVKSGNFSFSQLSTGPLRLELGLLTAKKVTLTFESPSSWISVNEVLFEICQ